MDVATNVERVPAENLHVRRSQFGVVWSAAESHVATSHVADCYVVGVLATCRWLAAQPLRHPSGEIEVPVAPAIGRQVRAEPETIEGEFFAAVRTAARAGQGQERARGVLTTLTWAWHGRGKPPLDIRDELSGAG